MTDAETIKSIQESERREAEEDLINKALGAMHTKYVNGEPMKDCMRAVLVAVGLVRQ